MAPCSLADATLCRHLTPPPAREADASLSKQSQFATFRGLRHPSSRPHAFFFDV